MNIDPSVLGNFEYRLRENQPIGRNHDCIRPAASDCFLHARVPEIRGLFNQDAAIRRDPFYGWSSRFETATRRAVWPSQDADYAVRGLEERFERARREFWRTGKDDVQEGATKSSALVARQERGPPATFSLGCLAQLLLKSGFDARLLKPRKIFDEDSTLEMVQLVLNARREQLLGL